LRHNNPVFVFVLRNVSKQCQQTETCFDST
jgi:hypothetical protein